MGKRRKNKVKSAGNDPGKGRGKHPGGRPPVVTAEVVQKLEFGFMAGLNDTECCCYAGISRSTLHNFCKENKEFLDRKEELKSNPSARAKLNITTAIENGDLELSKWWLERKNRSEFSTKQEVDAAFTIPKLEDLI